MSEFPTKQHVVIANAVYPPEPVVSARMGRDLAEALVARGHRVTVLCPQPSRPPTANYSAYTSPRVLESTENGVLVVRLPSFAWPQSSLLGRMWESASFGWHACRYLNRQLTPPDALYVNGWPLFSQALFARYTHRSMAPLVLHIQDIYPEALLPKLPLLFRNATKRLLMLWDQNNVQRASAVVTISQTMRDVYRRSRGVPPEKVSIIHNWENEALFQKLPSRTEACAHYDISENRFTFLYLGNIGPVAGVDFLILTFHSARIPNAQLVIAGDGSAKANCIQLAQKLAASHIHFVSDPDARNITLLQSLAHVCLLPVRKGAALSSIPSKLMSYLFSAKPVLATVDLGSDTAKTIREANCGWVGEPEDQNWLAGKMNDVATMPVEALERLGWHGREYGLATFSKSEGVKSLSDLILKAAHRKPSGGKIRPITENDALPIAALHQESLPTAFKGRFGRRLLACYYRALAVTRGASGYVSADSSGSIAGYVCGVWDKKAIGKTLLARECLGVLWWAAIFGALHPLALVRTLRHRGISLRRRNQDLASTYGYELRPIAVWPEYRGKGVANLLMNTLLADARRRGFQSVYLFCEISNPRASSFYVKCGFQANGSEGTCHRYCIRL